MTRLTQRYGGWATGLRDQDLRIHQECLCMNKIRTGSKLILKTRCSWTTSAPGSSFKSWNVPSFPLCSVGFCWVLFRGPQMKTRVNVSFQRHEGSLINSKTINNTGDSESSCSACCSAQQEVLRSLQSKILHQGSDSCSF